MRDDVVALFVRKDGPYPRMVAEWYDGSPGRDAREYAGEKRAVLHPPCARWGRFWWTARHLGRGKGDDDGCFASALATLRRVGGVLEHPEDSGAWAVPAFDLHRPSRGCWTEHPKRKGEWVTTVDQLAYGHLARKRTWLVAVGFHDGTPPALDWRRPPAPNQKQGPEHLDPPRAWVSTDRPRAELKERSVDLLSRRQREITPDRFAELLVGIASQARPRRTS